MTVQHPDNPERIVTIAELELLAAGNANLRWEIVRRHERLAPEDCERFWDEIHGFVDVVTFAELFWAIWTTRRYWDTDALTARRLLLVFQWLENDVSTPEEHDLVESIKSACPYLRELDEEDLYWTKFDLPVEKKSLE